jgi:hypothetical protein
VSRESCPICVSVVASGLGRYPFRCANGHTLYRGGGATVSFDRPFSWSVGAWSYRLPTRREYVRMWFINRWPDYPRVGLGD